MPQITGLPGGRGLSVDQSLIGNVATGPRLNADDFGAGQWQDWGQLGQQITRASVQAMNHFIQEDHQRQEDEARLDVLNMDTNLQKTTDELSQKKMSAAFDTPDEYLAQSNSALEDLQAGNNNTGRGGGLYNRIVQERLAQINNRNIQRLNRHVMNERENLHQTTIQAENARAMEVIQTEPGRLVEQLENVIYPNIDAQVASQGMGDRVIGSGDTAIRMDEFYKQQAATGALHTALAAVSEQGGPAQALALLSNPDMESFKKRLGPANWQKVFGTYEAKLKSQTMEATRRAQEIELNQQIAEMRANGESDFTIQTQMVERYGMTLGVSAVNTIMRGVPGVDPAADPVAVKVKEAETGYLNGLMASPASREMLLASAQASDIEANDGTAKFTDAFHAAEATWAQNMKKRDATASYRVQHLLSAPDSPIAQKIRSGTPTALDEARQDIMAMGLDKVEEAALLEGVNKAQTDAATAQQTTLSRELEASKLQNEYRTYQSAKEGLAVADKLAGNSDPYNSDEFKKLDAQTQRVVKDELLAREKGQYENDPVRQLSNHAKWDALTYEQLVGLSAAEQRQMFREVGGVDSAYGKNLVDRFEKKTGKTAFTNSVQELEDRITSAMAGVGTPITVSDMSADKAQIFAEARMDWSARYNDYVASHGGKEPDYATREAFLSTITQKAVWKRMGIQPTRDGTNIDLTDVEATFPEAAAATIRTYRDVVRPSTISSSLEGLAFGRAASTQKVESPVTWEVFGDINNPRLVQTNLPFLDPQIRAAKPEQATALGVMRKYVNDNILPRKKALGFETVDLNLSYEYTGNAFVLRAGDQTLVIFDSAGNEKAKYF